MMQPNPVPDMDAGDRLPVEDMTAGPVGLIGADQRDNQIQLRAGIDHPSDAAHHSVDLPVRAESIDVHGREARGLHQKFLVGHKHPRNKHVTSRGLLYVGSMTPTKQNHALASSQIFARDKCSKLNTLPVYVHSGASHTKFQFVGVSSSTDECAPAVEAPAHFAVTAGATNPVAKATKGKAGTAGADQRPVRRSTAGTGLRVGEASADLPATSEFMDVTAGRDRHLISFDINSIPDIARA
jgi:hypothetical protein